MRGKRAKILRKYVGYDMKEERAKGRRYDLVFMSPDRDKHDVDHVSYLIKGPRAVYKAMKKRAKYNRSHKSG